MRPDFIFVVVLSNSQPCLDASSKLVICRDSERTDFWYALYYQHQISRNGNLKIGYDKTPV